ncbi:MAG TPA: prepilin-type N-terminal cleavage/methylation domain-containing protein [Mobilitalea sp.]|nr:prepilin-type N-terminal cleavage/methylation domain-containing protein [Mobilitalea sp.]
MRKNADRKLGNKGFTLIELIISMAVAAVVIGSLAFFMWSSTLNYRFSKEEINLQMEAQTIVNQLEHLILEANNVKFDQLEEKLMIQQSDYLYIISHNTNDHTLEYEKVPVGATPSGITELFGQYIDSLFVVDTGSDDTNKKIEITLELKSNKQTYKVSDNVVIIRNRIRGQ